MTKKNNMTFLQTLMNLFKTKTKKAPQTKAKHTTKTKRTNMKGGMLRDKTVIRNMPKQS